MSPVEPASHIPTQLAGLMRDFDERKRTALARVISIVENRREAFESILAALHPRLGRAHRIGITGPPGAGKSTLTSALVRHFRERGETVAVIAIDPTSPFTGGALLGDRIRMNDIALDEGVFIRSMASRGSLGGLATTTREVADVMDAFGFDRVIIETVGVGQSELDIAAAADTTVVVVVPESGDSIQAMKAGLMEAADLFVVNKADRPGADRFARELDMMLHLRLGQALRNVPAHHGVDLKSRRAVREAAAQEGGWQIPVLKTVAHAGDGVGDLVDALDRHRAWLAESGELTARRRQRLRERVREVVDRRLHAYVWRERGGDDILAEALDALLEGRQSPYQVADRIVAAAQG